MQGGKAVNGGGLRLADRLIDWLIARAKRRPYQHLPRYMERFWLFRTPFLSARIHHILRSDHSRDKHDHPWDNVSIVLRGGYWEELADGRWEWRGPGAIVFRRAEERHRLFLPGGEAWTLFLIGRRRRTWGFYTPRGWVPWTEYPDTAPAARRDWGDAS